ncbi:MAG: ABC transporter ATP-binding protein [Rhodospirillaceae bacterium]
MKEGAISDAPANSGPANTGPAIDVRDLSKSFHGNRVVDRVSIRVEPGRICGFLGPNGSGKTTTIRILCGLLTPDEGGGTCLGLDIVREGAAIKRQVGYMTQKFSFYEDLSIRENLDFVARVYGLPDRRAVVAESLDRLGLMQRAEQLAGELSGGWKQRLALAACILHRPKLLLLDEPTAGVDPVARRDFWDEIHRLADNGMTVLVSTHYMDEAERCHEIAYLAYGRLLARGSVEQVIAASGLSTLTVTGPGLPALLRALDRQPGVDMTALFGQTLHVSGCDAEALAAALARHRTEDQQVTSVPPGLEDVFIHLMTGARDSRL